MLFVRFIHLFLCCIIYWIRKMNAIPRFLMIGCLVCLVFGFSFSRRKISPKKNKKGKKSVRGFCSLGSAVCLSVCLWYPTYVCVFVPTARYLYHNIVCILSTIVFQNVVIASTRLHKTLQNSLRNLGTRQEEAKKTKRILLED